MVGLEIRIDLGAGIESESESEPGLLQRSSIGGCDMRFLGI